MIIHRLIYFFIVLSLVGCASTGSPSGGPKDYKAPSLLEEKSSPLLQTNYSPEKVVLHFDEWIELKNQKREILISPPFFRQPKITSRGKKVTIEFPEEESLREDATYIINFGKSIVDFTEGNEADGFQYIFSTGDKIDSLTYKGKLKDVVTGEPQKDVLIFLYDNVMDSVVVREKPFYYTRTEDDGTFSFEYLKNDTFKIIALDDQNFNFKFDEELEKIAFVETDIIIGDSTTQEVILSYFLSEQPTRILDSESEKAGRARIVFNKKASEVPYEILYPKDVDFYNVSSSDTLALYFSDMIDSLGVVVGLDTLDFYTRAMDSVFYARSLKMTGKNNYSNGLSPFDSLGLKFNSYLESIDTSKILLTEVPEISIVERQVGLDSVMGIDSVMTMDSLLLDTLSNTIKLDTTIQNTIFDTIVQDSLEIFNFNASHGKEYFYLDADWEGGSGYRMTLDSGAITDIFGRVNDSMVIDFEVLGKDVFSSIALEILQLDSTMHYVIYLLEGDREVKKSIVKNKTSHTIEYGQLLAGTYKVRLIQDEVEDGKWTTGDYWKKRQPEQQKEKELEKLRENWKLDATFYWGEEPSVANDSLSGMPVGLDSMINIPNQGRPTENPNNKEAGGRQKGGRNDKGKND